MKWLQQLWPLDWFCVLTMAKDFTTHPVLGSPKLNARGLHVWRKLTAQRSCDDRRRRMKAAFKKVPRTPRRKSLCHIRAFSSFRRATECRLLNRIYFVETC